MDYKHSCVIDAQNLYKTFVLVLLVEHEEGQQEEKIQYYTLQDGEQLVDTVPPVMRPYAGAVGLITPRWDMDAAAGDEVHILYPDKSDRSGHLDRTAQCKTRGLVMLHLQIRHLPVGEDCLVDDAFDFIQRRDRDVGAVCLDGQLFISQMYRDGSD